MTAIPQRGSGMVATRFVIAARFLQRTGEEYPIQGDVVNRGSTQKKPQVAGMCLEEQIRLL
jgi:hypothetical protein